MTYEKAREYLESINQAQILRFYEDLSPAAQQNLLARVETTDFSVLENLSLRADLSGKGKIEPMAGLTLAEIRDRREEFFAIGKEAIRKGKVGAVLLAGGQGTRLGFDGPKGAYNIGIKKSLLIFEQQVKNLSEVTKACGAFVPLYIMTSEINHAATVQCWQENGFFGYPQEYVRFFVQEMAPACDFSGKVLLADKGEIALSPNGNGGWFSSMEKAGLLKDVQSRGIEWLNAYAVDNVLQRIADPVFIGATIESGKNCGAKVVSKVAPEERVGVLCLQDGKPNIIEYYEMDEETANLRDEKGDLQYRFGVILNYLFNVDKAFSILNERIPVHVVKKKVPYIDETGEKIEPKEPNAYKFETLILDMIRLMDTCLPFEVDRTREFAPVKNATGTDSVESARELLKRNGVEL